MIDQRLLPGEFKIAAFSAYQQVAEAITHMVIRGAPAIGAAAAFGLALAAENSQTSDTEGLLDDLEAAANVLRNARPTASNLNWALERLLDIARSSSNSDADEIRELLLKEAQELADQDVEINRRMGQFGASLLPDQSTVIHHCNTGALATVDFGTALGVIRSAHESGKDIHVLVDETRPRLQGARLTAWELSEFYAVVPTSTIDLNAATGADIPIEERDPAEVLDLEKDGRPIAPPESRARNPAFDITPYRLVTAIVTEVGVLKPPYTESLRQAVEKAQAT
jgi:methylthioribose-1-phosphate isomerase